MNHASHPPLSDALSEANLRLKRLRKQQHAHVKHASREFVSAENSTRQQVNLQSSTQARTASRWLLPPSTVTCTHDNAQNAPQQNPNVDTITLFPDIGLGLLRNDHAAAGRVWLLLRYLDTKGQGWIPIADAREKLTRKQSALRIVGWRQLRNLLHQGQTIFWQRSKDRIWLYSVAKVAAALGIQRLTGQPVALPLRTLLNGIGDVRAHFYASFHSGRACPKNESKRKPIARETLSVLSGVGRSSQLSYERRARVNAETNIAIGERVTGNKQKEYAWRQGQALFVLKDRQGKQGRKGEQYFAWQLPNSYVGPHKQQPKRQRKRINRKLADLLNLRATGNDKGLIEQRYFADGAAAVKGGFGRHCGRHCGHNGGQDSIYWHATSGQWQANYFFA